MRLPPPRPKDQRPRAFYIHHGFGFGQYGSVHKWLRLFEQVCDVTCEEDTKVGEVPTSRIRDAIIAAKPDFIIVNGDFHPQYLVPIAMGIPYVIFQHDTVTMRGKACPDEGAKLRKAAAVLFVSEEHRDYCVERYRLKHHWTVPLKPLMADMQFEVLPKFPKKSVGFAGSVTPDKERSGPWGYRCYNSVFKTFISLGWDVHVVTFEHLRNGVMGMLDRTGCITHYEVPQAEVYQLLNRCTIGLQGYAPYGEEAAAAYVHTCRPNKLYEYLAAGIPTLGINPGRGAYVYDGKWGVVSPSFSKRDIERYANRAAKMVITDEMRFEQAIEHHLPDVQALVDHVMAGRR